MSESLACRVTGSLLALSLGDAFGAPHEGGLLEQLLWRLIGIREGKRRWTDDTQMTVDVMESLIQHREINQDDLATRFANSYRWSRGYGPGAARMLKRIRAGEDWGSASRAVYAEGSYGNGAAMRSPAVGLFFAGQGMDAVAEAAEAAAVVTHAHPLAREGAVLIAVATALAFQCARSKQLVAGLAERARSEQHLKRLTLAAEWLTAGQDVTPREVALQLGRGIAAVESCTTAVYLASRFMGSPFGELLDFTFRIGGDVDTIGSMAAGIWGAARGFDALPQEKLNELEDYERLMGLGATFAKVIGRRTGGVEGRT